MNEARTERRSRWRWVWAFLFVFSAHAALVFWVGERTKPVDIPAMPAPLLYVTATPHTVKQLAALAPTAHPTLFALPNPSGFSGEAWLNFVPMDVALSNWTAVPSWLALPIEDLGASLAFFAESNKVSNDTLVQQLRPINPFELRTPALEIHPSTTFRVEGAAARRLVGEPPTAPAATNLDLLANTTIEIAVRGDGAVESAVLKETSGLGTADETALDLAKTLEFAPLPLQRKERDSAPLVRAQVIFTWHVVPRNPTNILAAAGP
jgi:hypothetical protein